MTLSDSLHVSLKPTERNPSPLDVPTLRATVQNAAPYPITILSYNSLLDRAAGALGIIHVIDTSSGQEVASDVVQFRKVWPPTRDAFVEIEPDAKVGVEIPLPTHKLETGKTYEVVAKWTWQGLWKGGVDVAMEACSKEDTAEGPWERATTEVKMDGTLQPRTQ